MKKYRTIPLFLMIGMLACTTRAPLSPDVTQTMTGSSNSMTQVTPGPVTTSDQTTKPAPSDEVKGCDIVQVKRAGIEIETSCERGVRFNVPAQVTLGSGYYNIWLPAINAGKRYGKFSYNSWSRWVTLKPGSYSFQLAAESVTDTGQKFQCDRHRDEFTIPECPPPPPPPPCKWQECGECMTWNPVECVCIPIDCPCVKTPEPKKPGYKCTWDEDQCVWHCVKKACG